MKFIAIFAAAIVCINFPILALGIEVLSPMDLSKVEFGSPRDDVKRAFPHFVDHQTDLGSAIRSGKLRWKDIPFSSIIWFDEIHALKSIMFSIHPDDSGQVKPSFERIRREFFETYGEPSVTDIRDSGYKRFEWELNESNVSVVFFPNARFAGNAVLSYRAPKTERAEQDADVQAAAAVK